MDLLCSKWVLLHSVMSNLIDVAPYVRNRISNSTPTAVILTTQNDDVVLTFDQPVYGYFADYLKPGDGRVVLVEVYNSVMGMIGMYTFMRNDTSHGIKSQVPITSIRFTVSGPASGNDDQERFSLDNIEIDCSRYPFPTISQWGVIMLALIMMIFGVITKRELRESRSGVRS